MEQGRKRGREGGTGGSPEATAVIVERGGKTSREGGHLTGKPPLSLSSLVAWWSRREKGSANREGGSELDVSVVVVPESTLQELWASVTIKL